MAKIAKKQSTQQDTDRRVLRHLRDVVSRPHSPQFKLDRCLRLLAAGLGLDACSLYVATKDHYFMMMATWGLARSSVHTLKLHISKGLVGEVARREAPVVEADVRTNPNFLYVPDIQEDNLTTFVGVPLIRHSMRHQGHQNQGDAVIGVLTAQTIEPRDFLATEIELLETSAVILMDTLDHGRRLMAAHHNIFLEAQETDQTPGEDTPKIHKGRPFNSYQGWYGDKAESSPIAYGKALLFQKDLPHIKPMSKLPPETEVLYFRRALEIVRHGLEQSSQLWGALDDEADHTEDRAIFSAYTMVLNDSSWHGRVEAYIQRGFKAAAAVLNVLQDMEFQLHQNHAEGANWILEDLKDLSHRLCFVLQNHNQIASASGTQHDLIVVAKNLGPGDLLALRAYPIKAIVLEEGGPNSHGILLAKSLGIHVVGWVPHVAGRIKPSDYLAVDATTGAIYVNPSTDMVADLHSKVGAPSARRVDIAPKPATLPAPWALYGNVGLLEDAATAHRLSQDGFIQGIGLLRSELLFLQTAEFPSVEEQQAFYGRFLSAEAGRRCCIRTLDIGSDKMLPYFPLTLEDNPNLGWRGVRITLDRPTILRHQVRAILGAAAQHGPVDILIPLVTTAEEFLRCKRIVAEEASRWAPSHRPEYRLGVMVETPSLVLSLKRIQAHVDFISVGTNDLWQFIYACDRNNAAVAFRYPRLGYGYLRMLQMILEALPADKDVTLCGDFYAFEEELNAMLGLGFTKFSLMLHQVPIAHRHLTEKLHNGGIAPLQQAMQRYLADPHAEVFTLPDAL